jgi:hypothetical protein
MISETKRRKHRTQKGTEKSEKREENCNKKTNGEKKQTLSTMWMLHCLMMTIFT